MQHLMDTDSDTVVVVNAEDAIAGEPPLPHTPFSCNVCRKSYTRVDHLARHFRSHSRERPFTCPVCSKTFARVDLLKRHVANHDNDDSRMADAAPASKRRRVQSDIHKPRAQRACKPCADAKAKCEGGCPCLRCRQKSVVCEYLPLRSSRSPEVADVVPSSDSGHEDRANLRASASDRPQQAMLSSVMPHVLGESRSDEDLPLPTPNGPVTTIQLPTPATFEQSIPSSAMYEQDAMPSLDDVPLFDFLKDIQLPSNQSNAFSIAFEDDSFPRDVLDFGVDPSFSTPSIIDADLTFLSEQTFLAPVTHPGQVDLATSKSGTTTPGLRGKLNVNASTQAFKESVWLWTPDKEDYGALEQRNLSLTRDNVSTRANIGPDSLVSDQLVSTQTRGRILAMVLRTCESAMYSHVVSNFPSTQMLTKLVQDFLGHQSHQDVPWVHTASVHVNKETPEFLAGMIASSAAMSQEPEIRKLGFAIQEAVRVATPLEFERDNRTTRELRPLQTYALHLDVGLWSGNRRKMEISESFAMPLITMIRRAGHFRRTRGIELPPQHEDTGQALDSKWHTWVQQESFKRLALYLFYRDTRSSMSLLSQPLVSYAELTTNLPCCNSLWSAKTSLEWKAVYLAEAQVSVCKQPSLRSCTDDIAKLFSSQSNIDIDVALLLVVATVWPQLWQYREMRAMAASRNVQNSGYGSLMMNTRHHELVQFLERIRMNAREWHGDMRPVAWLLHEQCLLHLYVSLEDVQLLAGKEGESEARRVFPTLSAWAESSEARQALYHAGQVVRAAKAYKSFMLRDASAVAAYHASLVFWAYAVLSKRNHGLSAHRASSPVVSTEAVDYVRLDGEESQEVQRFLMLGRGVPCIEQQLQEGAESFEAEEVPINEPARVMKTIAMVLQRPHGDSERSCPPLIGNLCKLMHSLGKAAVERRAA